MPNSASLQPWIFLVLLLLFSCQREVHFPVTPVDVAQNQLQRSSSGQCQPIRVAGTYLENIALSDTNFLEIAVDVKRLEAYNIFTNNRNGYAFQASGVFTDTGVVYIRLLGTGSPQKAEQDTFIVTLGQTSCTVAVAVQVPAKEPTSFTLLGNPEICLEATVNGAYVKNVAPGFSSYVELQADVHTPGPYTVQTDTVNGYYFFGSGYFTATGQQTLILYAGGIPTHEGTNKFRLSNDLPTCTFSVEVSSVYEIPLGTDYFPLSLGSHWNYRDVRNSTNGLNYTINRSISDTVTINGMEYKIMAEENTLASDNQHLFRRAERDYFEYGRVDQYNAAVTYLERIEDDLLFLKADVRKGTSWESLAYTGTITGGQAIMLKYVFTCLNTDEVVTINGKTYTDVAKIRMTPLVRPLDQDYSNTGEYTDWYYAKGIGLIYTATVVTGFTRKQWALGSYEVR